MRGALRDAVLPAFVFACLLLGGSAQGIWTNLLLQLLALALIAWALIHTPAATPQRRARHLLALAAAIIFLGLIHLVPLPPALWSGLPGRQLAAEGFSLLGLPLPWLSLSLAPYTTLATLLTLLPPLAIVLAIIRTGAFRAAWLVLALVAGTTASVALGVLQVTGPAGPGWYLYAYSNVGTATGFFANANHFAMLLVTTIPFLAALAAMPRVQSDNSGLRAGLTVGIIAAALVVIVGIAINGSLAAIGIGVPVLLASAAMLVQRRGAVRLLLPTAGFLMAVAAIAVFARPGGGLLVEDTGGAIASRSEMTTTSVAAAARFAPVGSGIGTFRQVYVLEEAPDRVERTFVNHAHNDYAEIAVETGIPGLALLCLFIGWWIAAAVNCWRAASSNPVCRAATIASAAILVHSLVDYPLRTAAVAAVFSMSIALMVSRSLTPVRSKERELRPARHLTIDDI